MSDERKVCPVGGEELEPWVRYCWAHGCYVDAPKRDPERKAVERKIDAAVQEEDVRTAVVQVLRGLGFAVWDLEQGHRPKRCPHCAGTIPGGSRQTEGLADLLVAGHGEVFFVELKSPTGRIREAQVTFRDEISENGVPVFLWRSSRDAVQHFQERREESNE